MTYNIAHGRGNRTNSSYRGMGFTLEELGRNASITRRAMLSTLDRIAALIRRHDPDVVVLNEVDFRATWSKDVDQVEYLARRAGMPYYVYGPKWDFNSLLLHFRCGNAVLSKHPISGRNARFERPSFWGWLAGGYTFMDLVLAIQGRKKINLLHSHLGGPPGRRNRQARILVALGRRQLARGLPVIITGDLNADPPAANARRRGRFRVLETILASRDFHLYWKLRRSGTPEARSMYTSTSSTIDHIIISRDLGYRRCFVPRVDLSDHRPMVCDIALGAADSSVAQGAPGQKRPVARNQD